MNQEQMLMLIVAFLVGLFFKQIMGQVCGGRLVEGVGDGTLKTKGDSCTTSNECDKDHPCCQIKKGGTTGTCQGIFYKTNMETWDDDMGLEHSKATSEYCCQGKTCDNI